jgi:ubiquinone/menaquinone biosynthesis C-methylase UbiE
MDGNIYYQKVADYYDHEACHYEERYWSNVVAQRIRQSFREEVKTHAFNDVLEIGCGTGLDVSHFGSIYPDKRFFGIDIAPAMVASASRKVQDLGLENVRVMLGTPEDLETLFPGVQFDHVYVFFGALNTVHDLRHVAGILRKIMKRDGTMVLTFVNKWYLVDMLVDVGKFRFKRVFSRVGEIWGGYSDVYRLKSRCFSPWEITKAFGDDFEITRRRGYSILYPAWYRVHLVYRLGRRISDILWNADRILNHTPAWCLGEYALYSFRAKD